jgi:hypothetical protein
MLLRLLLLRAGRELGRGLNTAAGGARRHASQLLLRALGLLLHLWAGSAVSKALFGEAQAPFAS